MASMTEEDDKQNHDKELYDALMREDEEKVIELCGQTPGGPLHEVTIHGDTVLHMATYTKQVELVIKLLAALPDNRPNQPGLIHKNDVGNTILHEAATANRSVPAVKLTLEKAPKLLTMRNFRGETAIFQAARYGKADMFNFLASVIHNTSSMVPILSEISEEEEEENRKDLFQRDDKTTILQIAVLTDHFDLARLIARRYEYLVKEQDGEGMTALQLLTFNPSAFKSGSEQGFLKRLIYSCIIFSELFPSHFLFSVFLATIGV